MADDGPAPKRHRSGSPLPLPSDPSIPITTLCPFLDSPDDVLNQIFLRCSKMTCLVTYDNQRSKMRLGLVCQKFKSRIEDRVCWKRDQIINLDFTDGSFEINGSKFNGNQVSTALGILLQRIPVEKILFKRISANVPYSVIWDAVSQISENVKSFALETIGFTRAVDVDRAAIFATTLCTTNLSNLQYLATGSSNFSSFWSLAHGCRQSLTAFYCHGKIEGNYLDHCLKVLNGCPKLWSLNLYPVITGDSLERLAALCNSQNRLSHIALAIADHAQFVHLLSDQVKTRIFKYELLRLQLFDIDAIGNFLKTATDHFPNLLHLTCCGIGRQIDLNTYLAIINNIFTNFANRDQYNFTLCAPVTKSVRFDTLAEIGKSAKIVIENGNFTCVKNNLTLTLKFSP